MNTPKKKHSIGFRFALHGIAGVVRGEHNIRIHILVTVLVLIAGFIFHITPGEWTTILLCIGMVIAAELFNSAIERIVDLVSPQWNKLAGEAKDIAAGAVLVCAITAAIIGIIIFVPHFFNFIHY